MCTTTWEWSRGMHPSCAAHFSLQGRPPRTISWPVLPFTAREGSFERCPWLKTLENLTLRLVKVLQNPGPYIVEVWLFRITWNLWRNYDFVGQQSMGRGVSYEGYLYNILQVSYRNFSIGSKLECMVRTPEWTKIIVGKRFLPLKD